jgi:polysaccharide export outer membrane protein
MRSAALPGLLAAASLIACVPSVPEGIDWKALSAPRSYQLGGGDKVRIEVVGRVDMTRELVVRPDGALTFPLVGDIDASGLLPDDVAKDLERRLERYIKTPKVSVTVLEVLSYTLYVVGEVKAPGEKRSREPLTVLQTLALSGGFSAFAQRNRLVIIRPGADGVADVQIPFIYDRVVSGEAPQMNIYLRSGDTLVIP